MNKKIMSLLAMAAGLSFSFGYACITSAQPGVSGETAASAASLTEQSTAEPAAASSVAAGDFTNLQYNADGPFGIDVDGWNTCDADGRPTPAVDTSDIVVAVVDSGVDYTHPDLKNVMWDEGLDYPELVAMGGGRYGINVSPCDTYGRPYDTTDPMDDNHHGTHVAGIIAAEWNGSGVSGVTGGAKIMAVKCVNNDSINSIVEYIRAYEYIIAAKKAGVNVRVINNSWHDAVYGETMDKLVREAGELGIVSVFAAGNRTLNIDHKDILQASLYNNPFAVIVGASDENGRPTEFTNFSSRIVDVFAPGNKIYSTIPRIKGNIPDTAKPYEKDGAVLCSDYSQDDVSVEGNHVNGVLGFKGSDGDNRTAVTLVEHPEAGKVLCLQKENEWGCISIDSDIYEGVEECVGGILELYLEKPAKTVTLEAFPTDIETTAGASASLNDCREGLNRIAFGFFDMHNVSERSFRLVINVTEEDDSQADYVLLKSMALTADVDAYGYDTGTSMATPAVAGEAAILSAAFPDEGADQIAARIIGSVRPVDGLEDLSLTGGIVSTGKALRQDLAPVLNEVRQTGPDDSEEGGDGTVSGELTVSGFFFGDEEGDICIDGISCTPAVWTDTKIMSAAPADLAPGGHLIEVVSAEGRTGCRYDWIGKPENLYERLPLPGRVLSGNRGDYSVTSDEFDDTFYGIEMRSIIGCDGALYAFCKSRDLKTTVFRYDIEMMQWNEVYNGGYSADSGICTWKGRILFFANDEYEAKAYLGVFDPETCTAEYYLLNDTDCEKGKTMVNNGSGVYVAGGNYYHLGPIDRFTDIMSVRVLDETDMTLRELEITGGDSGVLTGVSRCLVYDGPDKLYVFGGNDSENDLNDVFQIDLSEDSCRLKTLPHDDLPIIDNAPLSQNAVTGAVSLENGIMFSGRAAADAEGKKTADTYVGAYGDTHFAPADGMVSMSSVFNACCTAYRDRYYVLGVTVSEEGGYVFAGTDVKTKTQYGDVVRITVSSSDGGRVSREGLVKSFAGAEETFRLIPEEGYRVGMIGIDGQELSEDETAAAAENGYAFSDLTEDHELYVSFVKK